MPDLSRFRWRRYRRHNRRFELILLMGSVIIALNFAGISYAQWNQEMIVNSGVGTGTIDARIESFTISVEGLQGTNSGGHLLITGSMSENQTVIVTYRIRNCGTLPIKFESPQVTEENGLIFNLDTPLQNIDEKSGGSGQFEITACEEGNYAFTVTLPYGPDVQ